jgi:hypothetical protein
MMFMFCAFFQTKWQNRLMLVHLRLLENPVESPAMNLSSSHCLARKNLGRGVWDSQNWNTRSAMFCAYLSGYNLRNADSMLSSAPPFRKHPRGTHWIWLILTPCLLFPASKVIKTMPDVGSSFLKLDRYRLDIQTKDCTSDFRCCCCLNFNLCSFYLPIKRKCLQEKCGGVSRKCRNEERDVPWSAFGGFQIQVIAVSCWLVFLTQTNSPGDCI